MVLGTFLLLTAANWWLSTTALSRWQRTHLEWNYAFHLLFLLVPLGMVGMDRGRAALYGISLEYAGRELRVALPLVALMVGAPLLADALFADLAMKDVIVRRGVLNTLVFQILFVGYGEEMLYRGFFQGELNRLFGRRWRWRGTPFGAGLLLASLLFGIAHLLNPFNPLRGAYGLAWGSFAGTTALACVLGMVRERMGGLLTVALLHFGLIFFPLWFRVGPASGGAMLLAWIVAAVVLGCQRAPATPVSSSPTTAAPGPSGRPSGRGRPRIRTR